MFGKLATLTFAIAVSAPTASIAATENNQELAAITAQDQSDRTPGPSRIDAALVSQRDADRRARVLQILRDGDVRTDVDYANAALVFQHGMTAEDIRLAHALSQTAYRINPSNRSALWLSAASWDRLMMRLGQPQWYATQFIRENGRWILYHVNETVVNDEERLRVGARTVQEAKDHAEKMNAR